MWRSDAGYLILDSEYYLKAFFFIKNPGTGIQYPRVA